MTEQDPAAQLAALADVLTPWAIRVASTLGVPDLIDQGVTSAPELAKAVGADVRALVALLRRLVVRGVLTEPSPRTFALTPIGRGLVDDERLRAELDLAGAAGHAARGWAGLLHSVRTGDAGYATVTGRTYWQALDSDPVLGRSFDDEMRLWAASWAPSVAAWEGWKGVDHVVDVGGGTGALASALLEAHPVMRATIVERPSTAARARAAIAATAVADRCDVVDGDFFEDLPAGGDAYVLAQIVHDWPDDAAVRLLRSCAAAAGQGGRIVVVERVVGEHGDPDNTEMDLILLVLFGAIDRTRREYDELLAAAGITVVATHEAEAAMTVLDCRVDEA